MKLKFFYFGLLIAIFFYPFCSCCGYRAVQFTKRLFPSNTNIIREKNINSSIDDILKKYSLQKEAERSYPSNNSKKSWIVTSRFFNEVYGYSPLITINNKAVGYAVKGMYREAFILFHEILKEDNKFAPAYNNLGIIYERNGDSEMAFNMYSKACLFDFENRYYNWNFFHFSDDKLYWQLLGISH